MLIEVVKLSGVAPLSSSTVFEISPQSKESVIGRGSAISDNRVSRQHCKISLNVDGTAAQVETLGVNPTFKKTKSDSDFTKYSKGSVFTLNDGDVLALLPSGQLSFAVSIQYVSEIAEEPGTPVLGDDNDAKTPKIEDEPKTPVLDVEMKEANDDDDGDKTPVLAENNHAREDEEQTPPVSLKFASSSIENRKLSTSPATAATTTTTTSKQQPEPGSPVIMDDDDEGNNNDNEEIAAMQNKRNASDASDWTSTSRQKRRTLTQNAETLEKNEEDLSIKSTQTTIRIEKNEEDLSIKSTQTVPVGGACPMTIPVSSSTTVPLPSATLALSSTIPSDISNNSSSMVINSTEPRERKCPRDKDPEETRKNCPFESSGCSMVSESHFKEYWHPKLYDPKYWSKEDLPPCKDDRPDAGYCSSRKLTNHRTKFSHPSADARREELEMLYGPVTVARTALLTKAATTAAAAAAAVDHDDDDGGDGEDGEEEGGGGNDKPSSKAGDGNVDDVEAELGDAGEPCIFSQYRPSRIIVEGSKSHPDGAVESASLAAIVTPETTVDLKIPKATIEQGKLSDLQLESVVYASMRHNGPLIAGKFRPAFYLGDGAGMGKGRQIAAIILNNWMHGTRRVVWLSISTDLRVDARRDMDDINAETIPIYPDSSKALPTGALDSRSNGITQGVVFVTYQLISQDARLKQLVDWAKKDDRCVIVFDECHKAKNLSMDDGKGTKTGKAVMELQNQLPQARIVYCSATGATEVKHLGYMTRLGLWGNGTCFPSFVEFSEALTSKGMAMMELMAMEMKGRGMYLARSLSFQGTQFRIETVHPPPELQSTYDQAAELWEWLLLKATRMETLRTLRSDFKWTMFWSAHMRFFKSMLMSCKISALVELCRHAVDNDNKAIVIGLQSTGEAAMMSKATEEDVTDFVSAPAVVLENLIDYMFPTSLGDSGRTSRSTASSSRSRSTKYKEVDSDEEDQDDGGDEDFCVEDSEEENNSDEDFDDEEDDWDESSKSKKRGKSGSKSKKSSSNKKAAAAAASTSSKRSRNAPTEASLQARKEALEKIQELKLPINPLDEMIDKLGGPDKVAEMTGRAFRIEADGDKGKMVSRAQGTSMKDVNIKERNAFQMGEKLIAIISDAASTGVSLHADRRAKNQRRRLHITLELPWSADKTIQQFGRSHRSNQTSAPEYVLLITNIDGEKRFAAAVAKRLESMGALLKGDRRATGAAGDLSSFDVDNQWGREALKKLFNSACGVPSAISSRFVPKDMTFSEWREYLRAGLTAAGLGSTPQSSFSTAFQVDPKHEGNVTRFLNRLMGLRPSVQNSIFRAFAGSFDALVSAAKSAGKFREGLTSVDAEFAKVEERVTAVPASLAGVATEIITVVLDRGCSWDSIAQAIKARSSERDGYYVEKTNATGFKCLAACEMIDVEGKGRNLFRTFRPGSRRAGGAMDWDTLQKLYNKVPLEEMKLQWLDEYKLAETQCWKHGDQCAALKGEGFSCGYTRFTRVHVLQGAVLPIWKQLEILMPKQIWRIVRVDTTNQGRVVGITIPSTEVERIIQELQKWAASK